MKKIGEIMEEMGFKKESSMSSKAAFIKYLAKQAYNVDLEIPDIYKTKPHLVVEGLKEVSIFEKKSLTAEEQLEFKFDEGA